VNYEDPNYNVGMPVFSIHGTPAVSSVMGFGVAGSLNDASSPSLPLCLAHHHHTHCISLTVSLTEASLPLCLAHHHHTHCISLTVSLTEASLPLCLAHHHHTHCISLTVSLTEARRVMGFGVTGSLNDACADAVLTAANGGWVTVRELVRL
jgi:hypothetical protein